MIVFSTSNRIGRASIRAALKFDDAVFGKTTRRDNFS
jgi:hypothetical protein